MKILAYNINKSTQKKLDKVLLMEADVFILPEVACPSMVQLPEGFEMVWTGDIDQKGLGVIWKSELKAIVPEWFNPEHRYFLPLLVEDKLIMAAWPTMVEQNKPKRYPQILMEALKEYEPYLKRYQTIISGDMNCYKGQSGATKQFCIEAIFDYLKSLGYSSAYHDKTGEELGNETIPTFYYLFKENCPFFLDYTFTNFQVKSYELLDWYRGFSDHVGQMIGILAADR